MAVPKTTAAKPGIMYKVVPTSPRYDEFSRWLHRADEPQPRSAKRIMDVLIAGAGMCVFAAILPFLALIIKLDSRGPVFYSQDRIGINRRRRRMAAFGPDDQRKVLQPGRPFRIYKLRTMVMDAEEDGPRWATPDDQRVTRVGRFLRKSRLDEVPQFYNVLRGEMSVIGPRPERLCFIRKLEKEVPHYMDRLLVLPGITGLAQVKHGYDDGVESVQRKIGLDREYISKSDIWMDVRILIKTIKVVLTGEGAY
jgi:lipopolysaccharide/colanic/teichoic acid biosynthesis glycosyltransferase